VSSPSNSRDSIFRRHDRYINSFTVCDSASSLVLVKDIVIIFYLFALQTTGPPNSFRTCSCKLFWSRVLSVKKISLIHIKEVTVDSCLNWIHQNQVLYRYCTTWLVASWCIFSGWQLCLESLAAAKATFSQVNMVMYRIELIFH